VSVSQPPEKHEMAIFITFAVDTLMLYSKPKMNVVQLDMRQLRHWMNWYGTISVAL
jgi:hypothetical protein